MSTPFIGEIRTVGFNFAPPGWLPCNGALVSISDYDALFNLIGTTYGGDGQTNFALPDLRSRVAVSQGTDLQGNRYVVGQNVGQENVTLTVNQLGAHTHSLQGSNAAAVNNGPANGYPATGSQFFYTTDANATHLTPLAPVGTAPMGGNSPHSNLMPSQCINFIIATEGIYPSQN